VIGAPMTMRRERSDLNLARRSVARGSFVFAARTWDGIG
jgi:hypothetical protein